MDESFFPSDNIFDPSDPEQALITQQRVVAEAWKDQTEPFRPSFQNLSDEMKAILPVDIYQAYGIGRQDLAIPLVTVSFRQRIQATLISAYDHRGLQFPKKNLYAIANPDETDESPERALYEGCFNLMGDSCYRMDVPIHLTKEQDGEAFDFFFILKLARLPLAEIDSFLEYHRTANFDGDTRAFCRYLSVLLVGLDEMAGFEEVSMLQSQKDLIEGWCDLQLSQSASDSSTLDKADWGELTPIFPDMKVEVFRKFIGYFGRYESARKGNETLPILLESDIELLQQVGFSLPSNPTIKIKPNLGKGDKALLYFFFHFIWKKNATTLKDSREQVALFINTWFQLDVPVTPDALRKHKVESLFEKGLNDIWSKR